MFSYVIMSHIAVMEKLFQYKIGVCFLVWPYTNSAEKHIDNIVTFSEFQYYTSLPVPYFGHLFIQGIININITADL